MSKTVGFLVWNPSRSLPTVQHETYERAEAEAFRLSKLHPEEDFWVMSPVRGSGSTAKAFSAGKQEGIAEARDQIMRAERLSDESDEEVRRLRREVHEFACFRGEASEHQATAADCLLWFDGFIAAHHGAEERPHVPRRDKLIRLNAALQRLIPGSDPMDEEIPF